MVQLKAKIQLYAASLYLYFNSSMVQLKAPHGRKDDTPIFLFQFLYGTIKRCVSRYQFSCEANFNSSMVQLKEAAGFKAFSIDKFQFLYGTIKSSCISIIGERHVYFNSSMVQLKALVPLKGNSNRVLFQFLYGTIKRQRFNYMQRHCICISIPLWYN